MKGEGSVNTIFTFLQHIVALLWMLGVLYLNYRMDVSKWQT